MRWLPLSLALLTLLAPRTQARERTAAPRELPQPAEYHPGLVLTSSGSAAHAFKSAGPDTFYLYGGPDTLEGKFQTQLPFRGAYGDEDAQGWTHRDVTDQPPRWQRSDFNSPTGTMAMWCGRSTAQEPGWTTAPGYGNSWDTLLRYRRWVDDPTSGQTVQLSFVFNHDSEPGYDYFSAQYDSAGTTIPSFSLDGHNRDSSGIFQPLSFPADVIVVHPIVYGGGDYGGESSREIVIDLKFKSDGAWSDEDGLWPSDGAVQVDDLVVSSSEGVDVEDFEDDDLFWNPVKAPFAGDFCKVFVRATDIDRCRENYSPFLGFIDDGTPASNPGGVLWNGDPIPSIGTTSPNWSYGILGGWVLNYNGGVSFGQINLDNEWWSPEIEWDLPGSADDAPSLAGIDLRFSVFRHLPLFNGMFYQWGVRGWDPERAAWSAWDSRNFVYYSSIPDWLNLRQPVADLIPSNRTKVQIQLAVRDLATVFAFPGTDATPAPYYDNVAVTKYDVGGPAFATRTIDIFGDAFAQSGLADVSTQAARDLHDCRIDMNRSVSSGVLNTMGDSMIVDVDSVIPGVGIADPATQIRLHYALSMNPVFEAAIRNNAPVTSAGSGRFGWDVHAGTLGAQQSTTRLGAIIQGRWFFDLPDEDFMYPGDICEYYIEAVDDDGRTSTLPSDLRGFGDGSGDYTRVWTIRGLPTYSDSQGNHPAVLFWNDFGHRGGENESMLAFAQNGLQEGVHFDTYTTKGPSSLVDNGLGSIGAHGASLAQMSGYRCLLYESGDLSGGLISDGSDAAGAGGNTNDKGNDVGLLTSWFAQDADRAAIHFGDNVASYLGAGNPAHVNYLQNVLGVALHDNNVRDEIDGQQVPHVLSLGTVPALSLDYFADGSCLGINVFDSILPRPGALSAFGFELIGSPGATYAGNSAGVVWDRLDGNGNRKFAATFPYGFHYVEGPGAGGLSARSVLLGQLLGLAGGHEIGVPTAAPIAVPSLHLQPASPNPFNPSTSLRFTLGRAARGDVRVYNLRGELVRALADDAAFPAGANELKWNGDDERGVAVASGVYLVRLRIDGIERRQKLVLVK